MRNWGRERRALINRRWTRINTDFQHRREAPAGLKQEERADRKGLSRPSNHGRHKTHPGETERRGTGARRNPRLCRPSRSSCSTPPVRSGHSGASNALRFSSAPSEKPRAQLRRHRLGLRPSGPHHRPRRSAFAWSAADGRGYIERSSSVSNRVHPGLPQRGALRWEFGLHDPALVRVSITPPPEGSGPVRAAS